MKVKIPIPGTIGKSVRIDTEATVGATIGTDLRMPDGSVATLAKLRSTLNTGSVSQGSTGSLSNTIWSLIREKPANIVQAAALSTAGLISRQADGTWVTRTIKTTSPARLTIINGDGSADPTLDLATLADGAVGSLLAITRDAYGRVSGTRAVVAADIPALDASKITTGAFADARIAESNVTQHQAALSIGYSQLTSIPIVTDSIGDLLDPAEDALMFWDDLNGIVDWMTEIPDSFLSPNVALLDGGNTFTSSGFESGTAAIDISSVLPVIRLAETDQALNEKVWLVDVSSSNFIIQTRTDADAFGAVVVLASRTGTNADTFEIFADQISLNGVFRNIGTDQTGVAVTASAIHAALVNLGLITA